MGQWPKGPIGSIAKFSKSKEESEKPENDLERCMTVVEYPGFPPVIRPMPCVENWINQEFTTPLSCRPGQIYWRKDPSLCIDAVHPELVQLRDCNGLESQMFAMAESDEHAQDITWEGFLVGTGTTQDMCFKFQTDALHFSECDHKTAPKFRFKDFPT